MIKKNPQITYVFLLLICYCLFLVGCSSPARNRDEESPTVITEEETVVPVNAEYEMFQKVVGWVSNDTLLVHVGDSSYHELHTHNIETGETTRVYRENNYILSVDINHEKDKLLVQEVSDEKSQLTVYSLEGELIQTVPIQYNGYVTLDWNATDDNLIFISYYSYSESDGLETIRVLSWNVEENTLEEQFIPSLSPRWYSANVYLYINELVNNYLYIGDRREDDSDLIINRDISDFFLNEDTFIGLVESDIDENQIHLFLEYPFLVRQSVLSIPKVMMNGSAVMPYITQANRNGTLYGVIPEETYVLEEELGEYMLAELDFEEETVDEVIDLPQNAPVALSPEEDYVLYGWRFEYVIDLESPEIIPLLEDMKIN